MEEKGTTILEFKKSNDSVGVEIQEGTLLEIIIGIAEAIQIIMEETGEKRKNIIADIEKVIDILEEEENENE